MRAQIRNLVRPATLLAAVLVAVSPSTAAGGPGTFVVHTNQERWQLQHTNQERGVDDQAMSSGQLAVPAWLVEPWGASEAGGVRALGSVPEALLPGGVLPAIAEGSGSMPAADTLLRAGLVDRGFSGPGAAGDDLVAGPLGSADRARPTAVPGPGGLGLGAIAAALAGRRRRRRYATVA
jgi:hypothetical protein